MSLGWAENLVAPMTPLLEAQRRTTATDSPERRGHEHRTGVIPPVAPRRIV